MRQPVLFCTVPNSSLVEKKECAQLSLGACFVAGGLEHHGFPVEYYDLDLALNKIRGAENRLSEKEKRILTNSSALCLHLQDPDPSLYIERWADRLVESIKFHDFSCVALSLDRKEYTTWISLATLHFGIILARKLKRRFSCPVFVGGRQVLKQLGPHTVEKLLRELPENPVDLLFLQDGHTSFPEFLDKLSEGMPLHSEDAIAFQSKRSFFGKMANIKPKYKIRNFDDLVVSLKEIVPGPILQKYPEISDLDPFFLAPYKFSIGCPFKCAFCTSGEEDYYSDLGVENIVNTLSSLNADGVQFFRWFNNNVNFSPKFVESLTGKIKESGVKILFSDSANMRVTSPQIFRQLAEAGCVKLWYGTETVSDRMLHMINKKVAFGKVLNSLGWATEAGIWNSLNFIYNFPHESDEDFRMLIEFMGDRQVVDTCQTNEFMLLSDTSYSKRPGDFGIAVKEMSQSGIIGAYDEVNGCSWEEKQALGKKKFEAINSIRTYTENGITDNDYILFGLRQLGFSKPKIKGFFADLLSYLNTNEEAYRFWAKTCWRTTEENMIVLENTIFGNVIAPSEEGIKGRQLTAAAIE